MKIKRSLLAVLVAVSFAAHAETLPEFEQKLIEQYYQAEISGRVEADQYNSEIAKAIIAKVEKDPQTWSYKFPALVNKRMLDIHYSPDQKIKIYQLDVSSGGTMRFFNNLAQWKTPTGLKTQLIEEDALIRKIDQTQLAKRNTYFILSQSIGSNCDGAANISAYHLAATKMVSANAFQSKKQRMQNISVPFDCSAYPADSPQMQDRSTLTQYLIRVDPKMQFIDIRLLNEKYVPQNKFLRYQKGQTNYQYTGVVKP
ncbi:hypothetical protein [Acinetobacter rudis]|uniref:DUF1571 domain-containing protein n=1 Tax=Acinetobacter rudis CIP 110305 TaxID=421052 RepID=S3N2Q0_9GAMM|nr:hypothetical protein [Acinetobacter rudis]EPF74345.1 hypothetical protein F945_01712 [Acinetobacter rudis CIP 110305]